MLAKVLVAFVLKAVEENWGYVLGGNGEMYTKELAEKWAKTRNKPSNWLLSKAAYFITACAMWFGHRVVDCSGLIVAAFRSVIPNYEDQKADTFYSRCTEKGDIKTIPEIPGLCVWKKGHIGVYIGNGEVVEARGRKYGVVKTKLKDRPWTNWGKLADIDYIDVPSSQQDPAFYYIVVKSDTMYGIAKKFNVKLEDLIALNPEIKDPNIIKPGQKIWIRSPQPVPQPKPRTYRNLKYQLQVNVKNLVLRVGPSSDTTGLETYHKGDIVTFRYKSEDGKWFNVAINGQVGFMFGAYLKPLDYMTGDDVVAVQTALNNLGYAVGEIDGKYGPKTASAVWDYQLGTGLKTDAIAGPITQGKLGL